MLDAFRSFSNGRSCVAITAAAMLAGGALTGCANGDRLDPASATQVTVAQDLPTPEIADMYTATRDARLGPGDRVAITVLSAPDLASELTLDGSGMIDFPLIGQVPALGLTPAELARSLEAKLGQRYLRNPQITVVAKELASQRVTVLGAVGMPGRYPIDGRTTLRDAIAQARGIGEVGSSREVAVFRTVNGQKMAARFDLDAINAGRAVDPALFPNDQVFVATSRNRQLLRDLAPLTPLAGIFYQIF